MTCKIVFAATKEMGSTVPRSSTRGDSVVEGVQQGLQVNGFSPACPILHLQSASE